MKMIFNKNLKLKIIFYFVCLIVRLFSLNLNRNKSFLDSTILLIAIILISRFLRSAFKLLLKVGQTKKLKLIPSSL